MGLGPYWKTGSTGSHSAISPSPQVVSGPRGRAANFHCVSLLETCSYLRT